MDNMYNAKNFINQSKGIITSKECKENNINKYTINKLIKTGIIERYRKGIYIRKDIFEDEFYILQKRNPSIVYSYNTAMYLLNETERTPIQMDITAYNGYNPHHLSKNIKVHYVKKELLTLGTMVITTPFGFEVTIYNKERTICDLIRSKDTGIDKEQSNKFIRNMFLEKQIDIWLLMEYAKKLKCERKIRAVMEIFI